MKLDAIDDLGKRATLKAAAAAVDWAIRNGKRQTARERSEALTVAIKRHVTEALPVALKDAREAIEARMPGYADATFMASMVLAGVAAAKEVLA